MCLNVFISSTENEHFNIFFFLMYNIIRIFQQTPSMISRHSQPTIFLYNVHIYFINSLCLYTYPKCYTSLQGRPQVFSTPLAILTFLQYTGQYNNQIDFFYSKFTAPKLVPPWAAVYFAIALGLASVAISILLHSGVRVDSAWRIIPVMYFSVETT